MNALSASICMFVITQYLYVRNINDCIMYLPLGEPIQYCCCACCPAWRQPAALPTAVPRGTRGQPPVHGQQWNFRFFSRRHREGAFPGPTSRRHPRGVKSWSRCCSYEKYIFVLICIHIFKRSITFVLLLFTQVTQCLFSAEAFSGF